MVTLGQPANDPFTGAEPVPVLEEQQIGRLAKDLCSQYEIFRCRLTAFEVVYKSAEVVATGISFLVCERFRPSGYFSLSSGLPRSTASVVR